MNKEIAQKWVEALRSGKYTQETGMLRSSDGFCCLGVLCDLHSDETGRSWSDNEATSFGYCYLGGEDVLPATVTEWAGLKSDNGKLPIRIEDNDDLAGVNDDGADFETIADLIEKHVEAL